MTHYRLVPKTVLRDHLRRELRDLAVEDVVVTSRSRPVAVIISLARWNDLQDKVERLEHAVAVMELNQPAPCLPEDREPGTLSRG